MENNVDRTRTTVMGNEHGTLNSACFGAGSSLPLTHDKFTIGDTSTKIG
jgi:hypothetical protein